MIYCNTLETTALALKEDTIDTPDAPYVLVVDDAPSILSVVMMLLETEEHPAIGFSDSQKVIPFFEEWYSIGREQGQQLPAVVLLDLMMPAISGYDIALWLSQHEWTAQIPVVIMTADHRVRSAKTIPGATDWISKPFQLQALLSKLESFLVTPVAENPIVPPKRETP